MSFGAAVRALRAKRGWSQEELAFRVGTTAATISRVENGKHGAVDSLKEVIAREFGLKVSELIAITEGAPLPVLAEAPESAEGRLSRYFRKMTPERRELFLSIGKVFAKTT